MATAQQPGKELSPWWKIGVIFTIFVGFSILIFIAVRAYKDAPPIPLKVVNARGETVFTGEDILAGQQVFLKYALMENGTIWGHGAYLGPDFSAAYLHSLALEAAKTEAQQIYGRPLTDLGTPERDAVESAVQRLLQENRYTPNTQTLAYSEPEAASYRQQTGEWADYFAHPEKNGGLKTNYIDNPQELRELTAFFDPLTPIVKLSRVGPKALCPLAKAPKSGIGTIGEQSLLHELGPVVRVALAAEGLVDDVQPSLLNIMGPVAGDAIGPGALGQ